MFLIVAGFTEHVFHQLSSFLTHPPFSIAVAMLRTITATCFVILSYSTYHWPLRRLHLASTSLLQLIDKHDHQYSVTLRNVDAAVDEAPGM